jgi:hypothetical protein
MKPCPQPTTPRRGFGGEGIGRTPGFRRPEAGIAARVVPAPTSRWTACERLRPTCPLDSCCRSELSTVLNPGEGSRVAFLVWAKPALPRPSRSMPAGESTISRTDPFSLTNMLETCILPSWRGNDCPLSTTPVAAPESAGDAETPSAPVL